MERFDASLLVLTSFLQRSGYKIGIPYATDEDQHGYYVVSKILEALRCVHGFPLRLDEKPGDEGSVFLKDAS